jgi:hypothetical protein
MFNFNPFDFHEGLTWRSVMMNLGQLGGLYYMIDKIAALVSRYRFARAMKKLQQASAQGGNFPSHADPHPHHRPHALVADTITRHHLVCADCGKHVEYAILEPPPGSTSPYDYMRAHSTPCTSEAAPRGDGQ